MLSLLYSILFIIIFYVFYQYGNHIYNLDKSHTEVRYLLLPKVYQEQLKPTDLRKSYSYMFDSPKADLSIAKLEEYEIKN